MQVVPKEGLLTMELVLSVGLLLVLLATTFAITAAGIKIISDSRREEHHEMIWERTTLTRFPPDDPDTGA